MINYTKKWWLLGCHRRAEKRYSIRGSNDGRPVLISQTQFIKGDSEVLGLAHKQCVFTRFRFSRIFKFWEKEYSQEKLKRKINDYWDIYEACRKEDYISNHEKTGYPTVSNDKAYRIRGFFPGYFEGLFTEYPKVTTTIITIVGLLISFYLGVFVGK